MRPFLAFVLLVAAVASGASAVVAGGASPEVSGSVSAVVADGASAEVSSSASAVVAGSASAETEHRLPPALSFSMKSLAGEDVALSQYRGNVLLLVNVASECGLTPQYEGLESLYETYRDQGLVVLGFPCNQFGGQEPGSDQEIAKFCSANYDVQFPMFSKIDVNGEGAAPLYKYLTSLDVQPKGPGEVSWNFEKFVIDRKGNVVARFDPRTTPSDSTLVALLQTELKKK